MVQHWEPCLKPARRIGCAMTSRLVAAIAEFAPGTADFDIMSNNTIQSPYVE